MSLDTPRDDLTVHLERALLVGVALPQRPWLTEDPLEELRGLATTAGAIIAGGLTQKRLSIDPATYIGKGKVTELQEQVEANDADLVINALKTYQSSAVVRALRPSAPAPR